MKVATAAVVIVVAAAFAAPSRATAQPPVTAFDQLNSRVTVGDTVRVIDAQGREVKGRITELHDASIAVDGGTGSPLPADSVRLVQRRTKAVGRTALWGLLVGGIAGAALVAATQGECTGDCTGGASAFGFGVGGGIGAGGAAVVRAALPARWRDVYRAPGAAGGARISVAPVITPGQKGVAVVCAF